MKLPTYLLLNILLLAAVAVPAAEDLELRRELDANGFPKPIPVAISGFTGEVDAALRFDLLFMGFVDAPVDRARYLIQGNNSGRVEARVIDPIAKKTLLAKAFAGGTLRTQTHALSDEICRTLTPDQVPIAQTRIAFKVQPRGHGIGEIYVADYDGENAQAVTQDAAIAAAPAWAGRTTLFYTSYKFERPSIFSHNIGTGSRKVVAGHSGLNTSAAVSPDGRKLAMILSKAGSPDLYVSDLDGGNLRQLTTTKEDESSPCWAPDSQTICVVSRQSGRPALYSIPASGGKMTRISTAGILNPTEPAWSPDGKFIAFTVNNRDIGIVAMAGPNKGVAVSYTAGEDPVWAPNSRAIMFNRNVNRRYVLSILDVPTKQIKDIARISGSASQPAWAR